MTEEKRHKRGDVREDGMVFWCYTKNCHNGEWWFTPERFTKRWAADCKKKADHYEANRAAKREYDAKYYAANRESILAHKSTYDANNKDKIREYKEANRESINAYERARIKSNPLYAMARRIRRRLRRALSDQGYTKRSRTFEIVGCSVEELHAHIERQFTEGMRWERFSEIHIDHIIPVSSATNEQELLALNHYTNLQPLWAKDNLQKSNKILPPKV